VYKVKIIDSPQVDKATEREARNTTSIQSLRLRTEDPLVKRDNTCQRIHRAILKIKQDRSPAATFKSVGWVLIPRKRLAGHPDAI